MAISAKQRSTFAALHRQWWRLHMIEKIRECDDKLQQTNIKVVRSFVCLFFGGLSSHSRLFHWLEDVCIQLINQSINHDTNTEMLHHASGHDKLWQIPAMTCQTIMLNFQVFMLTCHLKTCSRQLMPYRLQKKKFGQVDIISDKST